MTFRTALLIPLLILALLTAALSAHGEPEATTTGTPAAAEGSWDSEGAEVKAAGTEAGPATTEDDEAEGSRRYLFDFMLYFGKITLTKFRDILLEQKTNYQPTFINVAAVAYKPDTLTGPVKLEWEGQLVKHSGFEDHYEVNGAGILRWHWVDTSGFTASVAGGAGLSYATEEGKFEAIERGTNKFLIYLMFELDFGFPQLWHHPRFLLRIHHRSGAFKLLCPPTCGANYVSYGIKFGF